MIASTVKIIVAGDGGTGKTCFLQRLIHDEFRMENELTKGVDFFSKKIKLSDKEINFVLWDFAGQDQFEEILDCFIEGSIAAFVLFDLTRVKSFESVQKWILKLKRFGNIPIMLIGTKMDLLNGEKESFLDDHANKFLELHDNVLGYVKISSKTGENVKQAFEILIDRVSSK